MKDKEMQRELWKLDNKDKTLDEILVHIRANEAIQFNQTALSNQTVVGSHPALKCHECGKTGHQGKDCKQQSKKSCGFCAGPKRCVAKNCKAFNNKCGECKLYGHFNQCYS